MTWQPGTCIWKVYLFQALAGLNATVEIVTPSGSDEAERRAVEHFFPAWQVTGSEKVRVLADVECRPGEARGGTSRHALRGGDVSTEPLFEPCREELGEPSFDRCNKPAEFILWGKLFPPDALGPRCYDHAAKHVGHRALGDPAWAIFDLRKVVRRRDLSATQEKAASS